MPQATDVIIDGAGYMLSPGTYTREQDGAPEGRTGRVTFRDFFGGQRRHLQLERDKAYAGLAVVPALNGQGVQPAGRLTPDAHIVNYGTNPKPSRTKRIPFAIVRNQLYYAVGPTIYRVNSDGTVTAPAGGTMPATIEDLCIYAEDGLALTMGNNADVTFYSTTQAASQALKAGERGHVIGAYAGFAAWNDARPAARPSYINQVHGTGIDIRILDYPVLRFANVGAELYAITKGAIYSYRGRVHEVSGPNPAYINPTTTPNEPPTITIHEWSGDWSPFFQQGVIAEDDFALMEGYGGDLFAWISGHAMRYTTSGDRAGWQDTGLAGTACLGGCVAGGYLIVSIISLENQNELWAWDGSGWWRLATKPSAAAGNWLWPLPVSGTTTADVADVILFHEGSGNLDRLQLDTLPASADFITSLIDAAERDKDKSWRKVGAVFATPERAGNLSSADAVTVTLDYSINGGATWTQAATITKTGNTPANQIFTIDATLPTPPSSRFLMLRVRWSSLTDWAPILTGLWAEFEILDSPSRRRRWNFAVIAADQTINRDGTTLTRTGQQLIAELWTAWQNGSTVTFRDLDYDADPVQRTTRIVGISEKVQRPADQRHWGDAIVSLVLVEV